MLLIHCMQLFSMDKLQEIALSNKPLSWFLLVHWLFSLLSMLDYSIIAHIVP